MKAFILAAGRGERMQSITSHTPKPLIEVKDKALIVYHIEKLASIGIKEIIINVSYFANKIMEYLGDGSSWGISIRYSVEEKPLETGGGMLNALPMLGKEPFIVVNADIYTDYSFENLLDFTSDNFAHLVLVPNPEHKPNGDFAFKSAMENKICYDRSDQYTYSGIGVYSYQLFSEIPKENLNTFPLLKVLKPAMLAEKVTGELYQGIWMDVGTVERLEKVNDNLK